MNYAEPLSFEAATNSHGYLSGCTHAEFGTAAITMEERVDETIMVVKKPVEQPVHVSCVFGKTLTICVKPYAHVHLVFTKHVEQQNVMLNLEPNANACIYYPPLDTASKSEQTLWATLNEHAHLSMFEISDYAATIKREITIDLNGKGAHVSYFALEHRSALQKSSLLTINHRAKETSSTQAFRGIYTGNACATFLGKVVVDKDAAESSATQLYKSVLLSNTVKAQVMPQLEISNSDIKASHGASIGELDDNALFYLRSRGLSLLNAKALLLSGMSNDILEHITEPSLRLQLTQAMEQSLNHILEGDA